MTETDDIKFMRRCLELASKAEGLVRYWERGTISDPVNLMQR
jgi:hypothetical protein